MVSFEVMWDAHGIMLDEGTLVVNEEITTRLHQQVVENQKTNLFIKESKE